MLDHRPRSPWADGSATTSTSTAPPRRHARRSSTPSPLGETMSRRDTGASSLGSDSTTRRHLASPSTATVPSSGTDQHDEYIDWFIDRGARLRRALELIG